MSCILDMDSDIEALKESLDGMGRALSQSHFDLAIQLSDTCTDRCDGIKRYAITIYNEELANAMYIVTRYCNMLKYYSMYWKTLLDGKYRESWGLLQDTIDALGVVIRFTDDKAVRHISHLSEHFIQLEKLYPFRIFASSEMVIRTKKCSICQCSILDLDCTHVPGNLYWGECAAVICEDIEIVGVALVKNPMDKRCIIEPSNGSPDEKKFALLRYFLQHNKNPLQSFTVLITEKYFFNEMYRTTTRNDPCPCNSGKKFKKCCGLNKYEKGNHYHIKLGKQLQLAVNELFDIIAIH